MAVKKIHLTTAAIKLRLIAYIACKTALEFYISKQDNNIGIQFSFNSLVIYLLFVLSNLHLQ